MKNFRTLLLFLWCGLAPFLAAAEPVPHLERDLGRGLLYVRVHVLPGDLPTTAAKPSPLVLDLRYAQADDAAAAAFGAWLQFRASPRTPVFVLVNPSTAEPVLNFLENSTPVSGIVTVGTPSSRFVPDLPLKTTPAADRAAYDALEHGLPVETLLADNPGKPRHDEASIALEHTASPSDEEDSDLSLNDNPETTVAATAPPPPLVDATLQRAVHLHRALLALKKI